MRSSGLNEIFLLAKENKNIIFIGSDLGFKVLENFKNELPNQFFMEGISEANIIGMSAGLAISGKQVFVNTIASFLTRRCLDQISINLCLENANVRLFANGGGYIYGPMGPTHTIVEDIALMMALPNMAVLVPCDKHQMQSLIKQSQFHDGPMYFRVARDNYPDLSSSFKIKLGEHLVLNQGEKYAIISNGYFTHFALKIAEQLKHEKKIVVKVIDLHSLRPLDHQLLIKELENVDSIVTMEEHISFGGIYSVVSRLILENQLPKKLKGINLPNEYLEYYGEQDQILKKINLDLDSCLNICRNFFKP